MTELVPLPYSRRMFTGYSDRLHDLSVIIPRCNKDAYLNSFFPRTARIWNSLPVECFPLTYDLSNFECRINRDLLTVCFSLSCNSMPCDSCSGFKLYALQ